MGHKNKVSWNYSKRSLNSRNLYIKSYIMLINLLYLFSTVMTNKILKQSLYVNYNYYLCIAQGPIASPIKGNKKFVLCPPKKKIQVISSNKLRVTKTILQKTKSLFSHRRKANEKNHMMPLSIEYLQSVETIIFDKTCLRGKL